MRHVVLGLLLTVAACGCGGRESYPKVDLTAPQKGGAPSSEREQAKVALRVAIAPVISPRETLKSYSDLVDYLGKRLGRPAEIIQRNSYAEVNELVRSGDCDVAFV